ncbi:hypothetical protein CEP51_011963 [Fusarium floridanum]|uniref:Uncharacterized protein n=1 Tax=Fusarium floridanum TaxID=1325733 RepID=A0A428R3J5_9HYPO|nr:hypothetical protein CEP51_011963 [Fusarium floridanum]
MTRPLHGETLISLLLLPVKELMEGDHLAISDALEPKTKARPKIFDAVQVAWGPIVHEPKIQHAGNFGDATHWELAKNFGGLLWDRILVPPREVEGWVHEVCSWMYFQCAPLRPQTRKPKSICSESSILNGSPPSAQGSPGKAKRHALSRWARSG